MFTKLTKHGDGLALIIDQPLLDQLKIGADTPLDVTTEGNRLVVTLADAQRGQKFEQAQAWAHKNFGGAFKRLAE